MNERVLKEALKLFQPAQTTPHISEYEREQQAIKANFERLKSERLARESTASK